MCPKSSEDGLNCHGGEGRIQELDRALHIDSMRHTSIAHAARVLAFIPIMVMAPFIYMEMYLLWDYGMAAWFSVWNFIDLVAYSNQV